MNTFQSQQQSQTMSQRHLYPVKLLATLAIASVVSMLLISGDFFFQSSLGWASGPLAIMGFTIYLLVIAAVTVVDWRGFLTMNGFLKWKSLTGRQRLFVGCLFVVLNVFFLGLYLLQAYQKYRYYWQLEPLRQKLRIAKQEAALGMIPQTDGNCHKCHQPLQLGAEFCVYCRERVVEQPRICPVCYARTLPDARWCPECGTQLDTTV